MTKAERFFERMKKKDVPIFIIDTSLLFKFNVYSAISNDSQTT